MSRRATTTHTFPEKTEMYLRPSLSMVYSAAPFRKRFTQPAELKLVLGGCDERYYPIDSLTSLMRRLFDFICRRHEFHWGGPKDLEASGEFC